MNIGKTLKHTHWNMLNVNFNLVRQCKIWFLGYDYLISKIWLQIYMRVDSKVENQIREQL